MEQALGGVASVMARQMPVWANHDMDNDCEDLLLDLRLQFTAADVGLCTFDFSILILL